MSRNRILIALKKHGAFRKVIANNREYYIPIPHFTAKSLPKHEVFYGSFEHALRAERFKIAEDTLCN
jgi:hypothetical protein